MASKSLPLRKYKPGFVLGANGYVNIGMDVMTAKIPMLHALLTVVNGSEFDWNDEIKNQLMLLAESIAGDIHEACEEEIVGRCENNRVIDLQSASQVQSRKTA